MVGLDTNVLIRYITQDDQHQCRIVDREITKALEKDEIFNIQPVVLCEVVWVLESAYGYNKNDIVTALEYILRTAQFVVIDKTIVWKAVYSYQDGKGDFADYYIGHMNKKNGADTTLTFDKFLKKNNLFKVLV